MRAHPILAHIVLMLASVGAACSVPRPWVESFDYH
jgi:hypothetical protein